MACCVFTAYVMNRLIKACEVLDIKLIDIQYNDFDDDYDGEADEVKNHSTATLSTVTVKGMTCAACVSAIESAAKSLEGIEAVSVSLPLSRASILHVGELTPLSTIVSAINARGYEAAPYEGAQAQIYEAVRHGQRLSRLKSSFRQSCMLSSSLVAISYFPLPSSLTVQTSVLQALAIAVVSLWIQILIAFDIHCTAWKRGLLMQPGMDTLISLSLILNMVMGCISWSTLDHNQSQGYFISGSLLTTVIVGGRYIQTLLEKQMNVDLADLYALQAKTTMVQVVNTDDQDSGYGEVDGAPARKKRIPAMALRPGDEIVVSVGSIIACDCYIVAGYGLIDQAVMTGESLPTRCGSGDFLMSGCRNVGPEFVAVVVSSQEDSALEQLIANVSTATETPVDGSAITSITAYFVQIVLLVTVSTFGLSMLSSSEVLFRHKLLAAAERATAILASACPCALGLASPSAVLSGISIAWSKGIIIVGGSRMIGSLAQLTHCVLDKTGTLTTGRLNVANAQTELSNTQHMLICAVEARDAAVHPVARALFKWSLSTLSEQERIQQSKCTLSEYVSEPGKGVSCKVQVPGQPQIYQIQVGSTHFFLDRGIALPQLDADKATASRIDVHVAVNDLYVCCLHLQDTIRTEAVQVLDSLRHDLSLELAMLTGDNSVEAMRVSHGLGIPVMASSALPSSKKDFIESIRKRQPRNRVAMVGDGVNDSLALRTADVGILISPGLSRSNRVCVQAADVVLTAPHLGGLIEAIQIAKKTTKQIQFNQIWALIYNVIAVSVAVGTFESWGLKIDSSIAGMLMAGSSISVVGFSLLLRSRLQQASFQGSQ